MIKTLVFDADKSLSAIGGDSDIYESFGITPLPVYYGLEDTRKYLSVLLQNTEKEVTHELIDKPTKVKQIELNQKAQELKLECVVFDTITTIGLQERLQIKAKRMASNSKLEALDQQGWGIYGDNMNEFIRRVTSLDKLIVIMNAHIDPDKDHDGFITDFPALKGSTKLEIQKWFDIIIYTKVEEGDKGKIHYTWLTTPSDRRIAKDRKGVLPSQMLQDFSIIIKKYRDKGINYPKILVLGHSGTGKTFALKTINHGKYKQKVAQTAEEAMSELQN